MTEVNFISLTGVVKPGHRVASGQAKDSPYERGTLEMQLPYFRDLGLDLSGFYLGTLNVLIAPHTFSLTEPQYSFEQVKWHDDYPAETFSFSRCAVNYQNIDYSGLVYYPHPETKIGHFQDPAIIEIIAPKILNLDYGDRLILKLNPQEIKLIPSA
ncbi:MAG: hypothetical protein AAFR77_19910 [Cyanobacteria bacterium J06631_2]